MKITCQDPAANTRSHDASKRAIVDLVITPHIYAEDEEEMRRHVDVLQYIGRWVGRVKGCASGVWCVDWESNSQFS